MDQKSKIPIIKREIPHVYKSPLPRQKLGTSRRTHSVAIAAFLRFGFGLATSAAINLSMKQTKGPAIPMMKLNTITNKFAIDGDLKQKLIMYVNPAAAGPNRTKRAIVLPAASYSLVMNDSFMEIRN